MRQKPDLITRPPTDIERKVKAVMLSTIIGPLIGAGVAATGIAALPGITPECVQQVSDGITEVVSAEAAALLVGGTMALQGVLASVMSYMTRSRKPQ